MLIFKFSYAVFRQQKYQTQQKCICIEKSHHGIYDEQKLRATKAKSTQMEWQHIESKEASGPIICHRIKVVYLLYPFICSMK